MPYPDNFFGAALDRAMGVCRFDEEDDAPRYQDSFERHRERRDWQERDALTAAEARAVADEMDGKREAA